MANNKYILSVWSVAMVLALGACSSGDGLPYDRESMKASMNTLDNTAYVIWGNSGIEWDADGERELYPTTEEGWQELVDAGIELVAMGKDLEDKIDTEDPRSDAWQAYAAAIAEVSQKLIVAAEEKNKQAIFDEGGVLYQVCRACHGTFPAPEEAEAERP